MGTFTFSGYKWRKRKFRTPSGSQRAHKCPSRGEPRRAYTGEVYQGKRRGAAAAAGKDRKRMERERSPGAGRREPGRAGLPPRPSRGHAPRGHAPHGSHEDAPWRARAGKPRTGSDLVDHLRRARVENPEKLTTRRLVLSRKRYQARRPTQMGHVQRTTESPTSRAHWGAESKAPALGANVRVPGHSVTRIFKMYHKASF